MKDEWNRITIIVVSDSFHMIGTNESLLINLNE